MAALVRVGLVLCAAWIHGIGGTSAPNAVGASSAVRTEADAERVRHVTCWNECAARRIEGMTTGVAIASHVDERLRAAATLKALTRGLL